MSAKKKVYDTTTTATATTLDRPTVMTMEVQQRIVTSLGEGNFLVTACNAAGISVDTFYYWKRLVEDGVEHAKVYADFYVACARATAISEENANRGFHNGVFNWQARAEWLATRYPKRWAKKSPQADDEDYDPSTKTIEQLREDAYGKKKGKG